MIRFYFIFLLSTVSVFTLAKPSVGDSLKILPVQSGGRIQPFDTFASQSLQFIYGKASFNKRPAVDILMSWMLLPKHWDKIEFIQIKSFVLKKTLNLNSKKNLFSPNTLIQNKSFINEIAELRIKQQNKEPLDDYFKSLQKLENRWLLYQYFKRGNVPGWIPSTNNNALYKNNKKPWLSLLELKKDSVEQKLFQKIISNYISTIFSQEGTASDSAINIQKKTQALKKSIKEFKKKISVKYPIYKKYLSKVTTELHYNTLNPFYLSWILYLLGIIFLFLYSALFSKKALFYIAMSILSVAFLMHGYGIALRSFIMGRPPVTNMYETVLWVPWIAVIFGTILWIREKILSVFVCSCAVALLCLFLADSAPILLGGDLQPLEAVLRSNFWLSTHVLIIAMSYSAFFLAFAIGDVLLFLLLNEKKYKNHIKLYTKCIDRSLQTGVILLAIGTFLGGVWADYSWGRFWGWDPKETWALISLLGYLALLHGRLMGWIKELGLAIGAVLMFFLIIMTWYGVNYGMSQGLHSYGFGYGGIEYVASFTLLHIIYVLIISTLRNKKP